MSEAERKPWFPTFARIARWRVWRIAACVVLLLLLLGGILHMAATAYFGNGVKAELRALKAAGKPLTPADLAPPPVPEDENGAPLYTEAGKILLRHAYGTNTPGRPTHNEAVRPSPYPYGYVDDDWDDPAVRECWATLVRQDREALDLIRQASVRPQYRLEIDYPRWIDSAWKSVPLLEVRAVTGFLSAAAVVASDQGQPQEALERLRLGCVLHRQLFREPAFLLVNGGAVQSDARLMRTLAYVAARGPLPDREARRLAEELGRLDFAALAEPSWDAERATLIQYLDYEWRQRDLVFHEQPNVWYDRPMPLGRWVAWWLVTGPYRRPAFLASELRQLRSLEQQEPLIRTPPAERYALAEAQENERLLPYPWLSGVMGARGASAMWDLRPLDAAQALRDLARTGLGLQLYWQTHGRYPATLDDLRRDRWRVPKDLFTDRDFVYHPQGETFVLYSLGFDQDDDRGRQVNWLRRGYRDKPGSPRSNDGDIAWGE